MFVMLGYTYSDVICDFETFRAKHVSFETLIC